MHFTLGENLGETLYEIATEKIQNGDIHAAYETYRASFPGMNDDFIT